MLAFFLWPYASFCLALIIYSFIHLPPPPTHTQLACSSCCPFALCVCLRLPLLTDSFCVFLDSDFVDIDAYLLALSLFPGLKTLGWSFFKA